MTSIAPTKKRGLGGASLVFALAFPLLLFLAIFLIYPTVVLFARGVRLEVSAFVLERLGWTLFQAVVSSATVFALSLALGSLFARYDFRGKAILNALLGVPFVVPVIVVGMGFQALFGARGAVANLEGTVWLVLLANVFYNFGMATRLVMASLASQSLELEAVARLEGAGPWQVFRFVTLPAALPGALSGALLAFLYTFASFGVPLLLGGPRLATLEVEMYQSVQRLELDGAAGLALWQLVVTFAASLLYSRLQRDHAEAREFDRARPTARGWTRVWLALASSFAVVLVIAPLGAVVWRSFSNANGFTLEHYSGLLEVSDSVFSSDLGLALWNNLRFALLALMVAVGLGSSYALAVWRSRSSRLDAVSLLPLSISSTVLGVALIVAYPAWTASLPLLIAVYVLTAYPFITRSLLTGLRSLEPSVLEAARVDGANAWTSLRFIVWPLTRGHLQTGAGLAFAVIVGEFAATLTLSRPEWATLSTMIFERFGRPGQLGEASALAVLLLLFALIGLAVFNLGSGSRSGQK
jgi:thiamine transport system permease protein